LTLETPYLYLSLNLLTLLLPLALSFDKKVAFYRRWKYLFPVMAGVALFFIVWDMWFTSMGVWGFNPRYLSGIYLYNLPIEEVLFFFTVPYACVFIYECVKAYMPLHLFGNRAGQISKAIFLFTLFVGAVQYEKWYTSVTFLLTAAAVVGVRWGIKAPWLGRFYVAWLICLIPFFLVNGILTGSGIAEPVVWYRSSEIIGIRLGSIPFEDAFYGMLLVLLNVAGMEWRMDRMQHAPDMEANRKA
jgi:lycopene cyclase domain-containing protein